jgi:oligopeptide transport system substrate-binding protein
VLVAIPDEAEYTQDVHKKGEREMVRTKLWSLVGLVVVSSMLLSACAQPAPTAEIIEVEVTREVVVEGETKIETETVIVTATPSAEESEVPKVLRVNVATYPDIIDPQKSSFVGEISHLQLMYEGLTKLDPDSQTIPGAAEKWEYNDDATELTFTLREGLQYSDGSLLNAKRFEYSLLRNINPETAGEYASITDEVLGAPEWRTGEADVAVEGEAMVRESVQALDMNGDPCVDYEQEDCRILKIQLSRPAPYFHTVMGLWVVYPAKEELIAEGGDNWWNSSVYHVGNGPYILESLEPFVRGYFVPNPNYWDGVANVDIEYSYINDLSISFQAYRNDEFDIVPLQAEDLPTVQADSELLREAVIYPGSCTFDVLFHLEKEPFTDKKVREAFSLALDRQAWVSDVLNDLGSPTLTWIPPGFPGYQEDETRWGFDPQAAQQALAESSYGSADNLPPIVATFGDTPRNRVRWEWLVAKWNEVLGVDIELNPVEPTTFTALTKERETSPQMYILGWCADYPDPQNWLSVYWKTGAFGERVGYSNPDFDALVDQADTTVDPATRAELYQQAQDLLIDDCPGAFMWNNVNAFMVKPWVNGLVKTPQDGRWPGIYFPTLVDIDTSMLP